MGRIEDTYANSAMVGSQTKSASPNAVSAEIPANLDSLSAALERTEHALGVLEQALHWVTRPTGPEEVAKGFPINSLSGLGSTVELLTRKLDSLSDRVHDLRSRLAL